MRAQINLPQSPITQIKKGGEEGLARMFSSYVGWAMPGQCDFYENRNNSGNGHPTKTSRVNGKLGSVTNNYIFPVM
ncbi:hypothetical protein [[Phormidium] sp. ETS-05]|uniref:hypothetical protein n=1 Tax=[Phormidium] sp. ETS-05 TaxID=222819 RepID=UPI0018EEE318|nr:hypothetical protein [[Phormidium] sp. ETS-05]